MAPAANKGEAGPPPGPILGGHRGRSPMARRGDATCRAGRGPPAANGSARGPALPGNLRRCGRRGLGEHPSCARPLRPVGSRARRSYPGLQSPGNLEMLALGPRLAESKLQPSLLTRPGGLGDGRWSRGQREGVAGEVGGGWPEGAPPPGGASAVSSPVPESRAALRPLTRASGPFTDLETEAASGRAPGQGQGREGPGAAGRPGPSCPRLQILLRRRPVCTRSPLLLDLGEAFAQDARDLHS